MILAKIFGSETAEKVLLYMANYEEGYALKIAKVFAMPVSQVQRQLQKFEREGMFVSQSKGRTRLFVWNPRYLFKSDFISLLKKAIEFLPMELQQKYFRLRTRPRRSGKP